MKVRPLQEITSNQNPKLKAALQLHTSRGRRKQNRIVIFGWRETERAYLNAVEIQDVFVCKALAEPTTLAQISRYAHHRGGGIYVVPEALFERLQYGDRSDGVVATATRPELQLEDFAVSPSSFFLVIQGIEKPGNLGAIVRSADGSGADGVIVVDAITDTYHPNSIRSSMGTVFSVPMAVTTSQLALDWLQRHEIRTVVARPQATLNFYDIDLTGRLAIVLGNETYGLTEQWNIPNSASVRLPMNGIADSLNVSVSASIMAYEAYRQRKSTVDD